MRPRTLLITTFLILFGIASIFVSAISFTRSGKITSKSFTPAHVLHGMILVGKVPVPTTTPVSDSWSIHIQDCPEETGSLFCRSGDFSVSQSSFNELKLGQKVRFANNPDSLTLIVAVIMGLLGIGSLAVLHLFIVMAIEDSGLLMRVLLFLIIALFLSLGALCLSFVTRLIL